MRGSLFVANPWARQPMRPLTLGQACEGGVCPITPPPELNPSSNIPPSVKPAESSFPVVPVVAGAGALLLAALILG